MKRGIAGIICTILIFFKFSIVTDEVYGQKYIETLGAYNTARYEEYLGAQPTDEQIEVIRKAIDSEVYSEDETFYGFTLDEIDLLARVVMSEGGKECFEVKQALAETIINRLKSDYKEFKYQDTLEKVVYTPAQWSTQDNGDPTEECYKAVYAAIQYDVFPDDMLWARANYVSYGYEYTVMADSITKFSTVTNYNQGGE